MTGASQPPSTPEPASNRFYQPELDGLRFYAFFAVFLSHVLPWSPEKLEGAGAFAPLLTSVGRLGAHGVDLFFVLSSFLITELLRREWDMKGTLDVRSFLIRRALRIWPLYFAFMLAFAVVLVRFGTPAMDGRTLTAYLLFAGNWARAWWGSPGTVADHLWSVSVEEQFYILWPFLLLLVGRARWLALSVAFVVVALATKAWIVLGGGAAMALPNNTLSRFDCIAVGSILALGLKGRTLAWSATRRVTVLALILAAGLATESLLPTSAQATPEYAGRYVVVAALSGVLLVSVLGCHGTAIQALFCSRPMRYLGKISYGLYVFHVIGVHLGEKIAGGMGGLGPFRMWHLAALALTIGVSAASYAFLERPFLRLKERFSVVPSRPPD